MTSERFVVTASPHLRGPDSTPKIMWSVAGSLAPVLAGAVYFFGLGAFLVVAAATAGAVLTEGLFAGRAVRDGSAAVTGLLLGLTLPSALPLWMAFLGGGVAMGLGKLVFGGLGQNLFNPALLGRAFLQAAFPVALTTWPAPPDERWSVAASNLALPFTGAGSADIVTGATPLGLMKFERTTTEVPALLLGTTGGSLGETSGALILLCGAYLALRNYLNWRIPVAILLTVALLSGVLSQVDSARFPGPLFMLFSGGLILGAVYMATDPVTSPVTNRGCWIFGAGIGFLVVVIRLWGGLPEGVMYAVLLMNAVVPLINKATQPRVFGARGPETAA